MVAEPLVGSKVAAIGSYGGYLGVASPFRNSPSPLFTDNQVLPFLLETLVWTIAPDGAPFAGLEISHAPVTMVGRLDGDWSSEADATESTLDYLIDLGTETGVGTVYGIVSGFAEESNVWEVFEALGPMLEEVGGSIGSHSRTHPMDMSITLGSAGWQAEVAGSLEDIRNALTTSTFTPAAYAFINPGNTIRTRDYGQFFADVELYLSHGFETLTPYSSGVQGFGLPAGVGPRAVINNVAVPDFQWLYASSWVYTVQEASTLQAQVLDYYQHTVGRGVIYNVMWHDYAIGGNAAPVHYPGTPSTLPLFETARTHFWQRQVYAPTVAEVVGKLYVSQGTVITSTYSGDLQVDLDYSDVPATYRAHVAGMGLRIHQQADPIRRVVIDGVPHHAFSAHTIMMPAPTGATQRVIVELGAAPAPAYRLTYASKAVSSTAPSGAGIVASLARPGHAMKFCFAAPRHSVVLGVDAYRRTPAGESCGNLRYGNPRPKLEIQPFDTGPWNAYIRRAERPLAGAYAIAGGIRIETLPGAAAVIELASPQPPAVVKVSGVVVSPTILAGGFAVSLPATSNPGSVDIFFGDVAAPRPAVVTDVSRGTVRQRAPIRVFGAPESIR